MSVVELAAAWRENVPCGKCPFIGCCNRTDCEDNFIEFIYEIIKGGD